ncbi:PIN domain-containing protein [Peribacillus simplex]|uniref:PIN domain-containing protein n=1 Tax=Peribacillus simplex TaxID=1478 RepID=UPI0036DBAC08
MNIFLDSNAFYKDPFLIKGKNRILLSLAKHDDVKIYINDTVYEEILRAHKNLLEKEINIISESFAKINTFLEMAKQKVEVDVDLALVLQDFSSRFDEIQDAEQMEIILYDSDVLECIVEIDMYEKAPFIKKTEMKNNKDQKITITKKEIRDAIIWYSYQIYIKKNKLDDCYFISNNTREFGDDEAKKSPGEQPYNLHPEISNNNLIAYKTVHDFLVHNDERVKNLFMNYIQLNCLKSCLINFMKN